MLKRFVFSNFKNFKSETVIDFANPAKYAFNQEIISNGVKSKAIFYGINGSGKSNLVLALFDIVSHLTDKERAPSKYYSYVNLETGLNTAKFKYELEFFGSDVIYEYEKRDLATLTYEKLNIGGETVIEYDFSKREGFVSLAGAESLQISSDLPSESDKISRVKFVRNNAILQDAPTNEAFLAFLSFVDRMLMFYSLDGNGYQGLSVGADSYTRGIIESGKMKAFEKFLAEQGINFDLVAVDFNGLPELYCKYGETSVPFSSVASTGTKSLGLLYYWYIKMSDASLVFIDDFDAFYHFELSEAIVVLLKQLRNVQVFMTTHNTDLLSNDLLRPDAYYIIQDGVVDSLDNLTHKELRSAHNIQKMFKAGSFNR